jgi:hypothetical protein
MPVHSQETHLRVERLCAVHSRRTVAEITRVPLRTVNRMAARGFRPAEQGRKRAMPADFAIQERHMSHAELQEHYRADSRAVTRWRRQLRERCP